MTAVDVHEHMLARAEEHPICMALLLDLRLIEIALTIRDTEKSGRRGDVDMFLSTTRLAMSLFTT